MSKRNKLQKFAELLSFPNVIENFDARDPQLLGKDGTPVERRGKWRTAQFANTNPLTLELACGRGEYSLGLARMYPERNFIGVDIKGARIWKGASIALDEGLENVAFLRTRIEQIQLFFDSGEVDEVWITFPDPFLKDKKENRRLTAPGFIDRYRYLLPRGGLVHLKTDSPELYEYSLEICEQDPQINILYRNEDIYSGPLLLPELDLKTYYERMHLRDGKTIKYLQFTVH